MKKIEIKKMVSSEKNVSLRTVTYDVYVNGEYVKTFDDINDAIDFKEREAK